MAEHTPPCTYDANLTQNAFFAIYDRAQQTVKKISTDAMVVAPSIADGGPGNFGFTKTIFPWLQAFLKHAHAHNTLPDVLSWHVSSESSVTPAQSAFVVKAQRTAAEVGLGGSQRAHRRHKLAVLATPARLR
jgi:hypothetical protein